MELIFIVHHDYFTGTGSDHRQRGAGNEDRICVRTRPGLTAAVICDGAGSFGSGAAAAELTASHLSVFLLEQFEDLYVGLADPVQRTVVQTVERCLAGYAQENGIESADLACTILAAAVHEDGRCICLHLGDGIILQQNAREDAPSVVSSPMTGLVPHSTYLTMNCDLHRYLRFYRWQCDDLTGIVLLSDGAAEHLVRLSGGSGWVCTTPAGMSAAQLCAVLSRRRPRDDHSCVVLTRTTEITPDQTKEE